MTDQVAEFPAFAEAPGLCLEVILAESLENIVAVAESAFDGEACLAFRDGARVEVELVCGAHLVEVVYDADSGELLDSQVVAGSRRCRRSARALSRSVLSLLDAIDLAKRALGPGEVLWAALATTAGDREHYFDIHLRTADASYDVHIDPNMGRLLRVVAS